MGKIEDCFGSLEEGQLYAVAAFEQPILRLAVEDLRSLDTHDIRIQAIAGIVTATELTVPEADSIPEPGLDVVPASIASVTVDSKTMKSGKALQRGLHIDVQPQTTLLIRRPAMSTEAVKPRVVEIIDNRQGTMTVSRTPLIRTAMREMFQKQDTGPYASAMFNLSKIALSNMWHE